MGQHAPTHDPRDPSQKVTHLTHDPSTHCLLWLRYNTTSRPIPH